MRLLVLSDLHDEQIFLDYFRNHYSKSSFDAVFICGDITNGSYSYAKDVISLFPKTYFIPGNNEPKLIVERLSKEGGWTHGISTKLEEFNVVGFGFSNPTPFNTVGELEEDDIYLQISKLPINEKTLFLCHAPPYGYFDKVKGKCVGSTAILKIIKEKKPFAVFCGHVHEYSGVEKIDSTYLVKIPAAVNGFYGMVHINNTNLSARFLSI
ncbi:metallophosphoesterase family protein [Candidatus Micrarchaeota archaeon]|nr:metallophosphoesterase family protein [Candidatus Micrarchaeota archaeon]